MSKIVELLKQKNQYLEKFCSISEEELQKVKEEKFETLQSFYDVRETILDIVTYLDLQIIEEEESMNDPIEDEIRTDVKTALESKDFLLKRILSVDLEILECIENEKTNIIKELQDVKKAKKVMKNYKSTIINNKLNENV